ncbi:MAG: flavin reductase family protein [Chitinophagaceae bacterium]|jgi:flavin reductase (DIM6/NTAB) family NADH-FMN oxidoreductase RutF|nr:flavin reductase family protein [Chitinophagaceae bacterium]
MIISLQDLKPAEKQYYLQHIIAPRPICFASTIDVEGNVNLSPFSFFNIFSSNPPVVIFSPARRVRDNTTKHTLQNVLEVPEVVINMVTYDMVQQTSLASCEYPKTVNEFTKAGFTMEKATVVRPPMVKESLAKMECRVMEIKSLGEMGGAGQLVICKVLVLHIDENLFEDVPADEVMRKLDQRKIHHVARLGGDWYCQVNEHNLFKVIKPSTSLGIGVDALPAHIRNSKILTGNNLGLLANVKEIPVIEAAFNDDHLKQILQYYSINPPEMEKELHLYASSLLSDGKVQEAWQVLLSND